MPAISAGQVLTNGITEKVGTSDPWLLMQRSKKLNKTTRGSEWRSVLKKDLTGPTLLEISD
jgi:hypothetical protein